ncbi:hypothetical protein KJ652_04710 [Patescibacteria group bacterium]|nr:hypothetical protein [Patescibacteria group bacterium]MBU1123866.1 hypothetical protein [Patescibacteria group bacterium]MBU1910953.1 hypothetical protein [Patescibacteria group bacterium]
MSDIEILHGDEEKNDPRKKEKVADADVKKNLEQIAKERLKVIDNSGNARTDNIVRETFKGEKDPVIAFLDEGHKAWRLMQEATAWYKKQLQATTDPKAIAQLDKELADKTISAFRDAAAESDDKVERRIA